MSTTCKWEYYCNVQKQRAKTACFALRAQMLAFEEKMLADQWTARQEQIRVEYELCVAACGCQTCDCETQCVNTKNQMFAFFQNQYNTDLAETQARYTCCDEEYCTQYADTAYQICCDTNGPIGNSGNPDTAIYSGIYTPVPDFGIKDTSAISNFVVQTQSGNSQNTDSVVVIVDKPVTPVNCVNVLITVSRNCQNAAWDAWLKEETRIKNKLKQDLDKCSANRYLCQDSKETCDQVYSVCVDNAKTEAESKTKINDDTYRRQSGKDPRTGQEIPGANVKPFVRPPCVCCRKAQDAYSACLYRRSLQTDTQSTTKYPY